MKKLKSSEINSKKLCVIIPFRDRHDHLNILIPELVDALQTQKLDYRILIVEQQDGRPFNRGMLLNIGVHNTKASYDNYCFHDVDLIPEVYDYSYCEHPTHLSQFCSQFDYKMPYDYLFGGVTMFDRESFLKVNGYSNLYWGWGCEDDDMFTRCSAMGVQVSRKPCYYRSLDHQKAINLNYTSNLDNLKCLKERFEDGRFKEGYSTLVYDILDEKNLGDKIDTILVRV